ncbi:CamS family sex pheromone protein [Marinococcus sp. PL1-022]|uniref:CamS family sex pheromone protein n=1 Tax=Marinococcus sp. PL1-022 TaxID=3095363 RepID=UPI0029C5EC22|nr:CamS family sex pheromone protein [Marinococcus sp. PL1-022]MDX6153615.1 CamS family sex pheromone protein [Marinococcus sp. PL1-022]
MRKRAGLVIAASVFALSGCGLFGGNESESENSQPESEEDLSLSAGIPSLDEYYRAVLTDDGQYVTGESRGLSNAIVYNRFDLERMEIGMQELASEEFSQDNYYFREGQIIERSELNSWLLREGEEEDGEPTTRPKGLNPPLAGSKGDGFEERERSEPRTMSNLLEHNYMEEGSDGLELGGIVIGLSMNETYYFREEYEDGTYGPWLEESISEENALEDAKRIAGEITERLRNENRDNADRIEEVPIMFTVFQEAPRDSSVPGTFIATGMADPGQEPGSWNEINESNYLFPSSEAEENNRSDSEMFNEFSNEVNSFFDSTVGVVGEGHYVNGELDSLTIDIPIQFYSKTEIIAFTQHVADKTEDIFPNGLEVEVNINSSSGQEALITKDQGEDMYVHVYNE